jgi:Zn-dependent protease with chaperone function
MDSLAFRSLVSSCEYANQHDPKAFRRQTVLWALGGYVAIIGVLLLGMALLAWLLQRAFSEMPLRGWMFVIGLAALSLVISIARALVLPTPKVRGVKLTRQEAPRLFKLIDSVRKRAAGPRLDEVLIDTELNACVIQRPRLGLLGWHRNTLVLGLPLMMCLDARQLASVVAHEWGHLSGAHGKLGGWIYRTRRSWFRLMELRGSGDPGWADLLLAAFLREYFPRFNARAFVLGRQQEYEADAAAHAYAGRTASAQALLTIDLAARFMHEEFWPQVYARAREMAEPDVSPMAELQGLLALVSQHPDAARWLREACRRLPDTDDTHPSLRQRLEYAHKKPALPPKLERSAAEEIFGKALPALVERMDARWRRHHKDHWHGEVQRYKDWQRVRQDLLECEAQTPLNGDETFLLWRAVRQLEDAPARRKWLQTHLNLHPKHDGLRHALALELLDGRPPGDEREGLALLQEVAAGNGAWALPAAQRALDLLERGEFGDAVKRAREQVRALSEREEMIAHAQQDFEGGQDLRAISYSKLLLKPALGALIREKAVGAAYLVRKQIDEAPERVFCLLVVERGKARPQPDVRTWWMELQRAIDLPCEFMVIDAAHPAWSGKDAQRLLRQMTEVPNACIYRARG